MKEKNDAIEEVKKNGMILNTFSDILKNNYEVIEAAVKENGLSLQFASEDMKKNPDIVKIALKEKPLALEFASDNLRKNYSIVFDAVRKDHTAIKFALGNAQNHEYIFYEVFKGAILKNEEYSTYLQYASDQIKNDENFIKNFITDTISNGDRREKIGCLTLAPAKIKNDFQFIISMINSIDPIYNIQSKILTLDFFNEDQLNNINYLIEIEKKESIN